MWQPSRDKIHGEHLACSFYHEGEHYRCKLSWRNTGDWKGFENQWVPWLDVWHTDEPMTMYGTFAHEKHVGGNIGGERHICKRRMRKVLQSVADGITEEKIANVCK